MRDKTLQKSVDYIDHWLQFRYEKEEIPGFVAAIAHKGKVIFCRAYGYANLETKEKLTTDHIFRIASHSKTFTATSIMQLQEKGKLRIDDYVADYVEWLKQHKDKRWQKVTIRQLMSHSAGVIRDGLACDYWSLEAQFPDSMEFKKELLKAELVFDNNVQMKYSNYGYTLLGLVIEAVSGIPYNDYVTQNIIKPLKLKNTLPEYKADIKLKMVTGYSRRDFSKKRLPISQIDTRAMSAATGFCSTAEDLCRYASAHFLDSGELLDIESKKEMQRLQVLVTNSKEHDEYCLGFEANFVKDHRLIGHGGGFPGHITKTLFDPREELAVVVLTNAIDGPAGSINKGIISIIDWFKENDTAKPIRDLTRFEGRFAHIWSITDIVASGDKIISAVPNSWTPFSDIEELEYINPTTLKIKKADGFYSEGEFIRYVFNGDEIAKIVYAGSTMVPEKEWFKQKAKLKEISQKA